MKNLLIFLSLISCLTVHADLEKGKALYMGAGGCFACHQLTGKGIPNIIPPLEKSVWVTGNPDRLITITLKGVEGPMKVNGMHYMGSMPPQSLFNDAQLALILTYVRNSFGNKAPAITEKMVAAVRSKLKGGNSVKEIVKAFPFNGDDAKLNGVSNKKVADVAISTEKPTVVRTFMPGASPAAFAVALPQGQHFCWDAGECRLRYVWAEGGFISNNKRHWSSNGKPVAELKGKVYYRAKNSLITLDQINDKNTANHRKAIYDTTQAKDFPITIGDSKAGLPKYKGYRLINHHPQFWYQSAGHDIFELITATADKKGIVRNFKIDSKGKNVTISLTSQPTAAISADKGKLNNGILTLSATEAADFNITIKENK